MFSYVNFNETEKNKYVWLVNTHFYHLVYRLSLMFLILISILISKYRELGHII